MTQRFGRLVWMPRVALLSCLTLALSLGACANTELSEPGPDRGDASGGGPDRDAGTSGGARDVGRIPDAGSAADAARDAAEEPADADAADTEEPDTGSDTREDATLDVAVDTAPECLPPRTLCGDDCVLLGESVNHCGVCNNTCGAGEVCVGGRCATDCGALTSCGGDCVDPQTSLEHCGTCDSPCRAGEACEAGVCRSPCDRGETECDGACVNTQTNRMHCGSCGTTCDASRECVGGVCACPDGREECNGRCIDVTSDAANCGGCGLECGLGEACRGSLCVCDSGLTRCGDACTDLARDAANCSFCGNACPAGEICIEGACDANCGEGQLACDGACVTPASDPNHCGGCGVSCLPGQTCEAGSCACAEETTLCGDACRDLASDELHCGACDNACAEGQSCSAGACVCPEGTVNCGGVCRTVSDDPENCGTCGVTCSAGAVCVEGACTCPEGTAECGAGCIDVTSDPANCGACDVACEDDFLCADGACTDACPAGLERCEGRCVDTGTSDENCGACGNVCADLESCQAGVCACQDDHLEVSFDPTGLTYVSRGNSKTPALRGAQLQGLVLCAGDTDHYAVFAAGADARMYFELSGACEADPTGLSIELQSPGGTVLASSNAGGVGTCPALQYRTGDYGWHTLIVSGGDASATYALDVRIDDISEDESNDGLDTADGPVSRDASFVGAFDNGFFTGDPRDMYRFDVLEYATIRVETVGQSSACDGDSVLRLLDAAGAEIASDDDGGSGLCSRIERFVEPGVYFAEVTKYSGESDFAYRLRYEMDSQFELEPNDTTDFANDLGAGTQSVEGAIQRAGDADRFRVSVGADSTLQAWTSGLVERCATDTVVTVFAADGATVVATNDDTRDPDTDELVTLCSNAAAAVSAGDYVVEVRGYGASVGEYLLHLVTNE